MNIDFNIFKTGTFFYKDGSRYEGCWRDGTKNGQGKQYIKFCFEKLFFKQAAFSTMMGVNTKENGRMTRSMGEVVNSWELNKI